MPEQPVIEIFKTGITWVPDNYHERKTREPIYVVKAINDSEDSGDLSKIFITDNIHEIPINLLSLYEPSNCNSCGWKPPSKIKLFESKERKIIGKPRNTYLETIDEPLDYSELSDLATAFALDACIYPHYSFDGEKQDIIEIYNVKLQYGSFHNKIKETKSCYVAMGPNWDSYLCVYDDISKMAKSLLSHFDPETTSIKLPQYGEIPPGSFWTENNCASKLSHLPLKYGEISDLLTGFAYELHKLKTEYEKNSKLGCAQKVY